MVKKKFIFNSSLPRSGSSLIQNLLAQNPKIFASGTSPCLELIYATRQQFWGLKETAAADWLDRDKAILGSFEGILEGFYGYVDKPIVVDKNRGWSFYSRMLNKFHPNPKIIICIRDLRAIYASMEKIYRKNQFKQDNTDNPSMMIGQTMADRVLFWSQTAPVGIALKRLQDVLVRKDAKHMHFIRYEELTQAPKATMINLYNYIEEPYFEHDFVNTPQLVPENDNFFEIYGDHKIKNTLSPVPFDYVDILGSELCSHIVNQNMWFYKTFYPELV